MFDFLRAKRSQPVKQAPPASRQLTPVGSGTVTLSEGASNSKADAALIIDSYRSPFWPSYLSLYSDVVIRHATWSSCESRVKGQSNAKFKKVKSPQEEKYILNSWGLDLKTLIFDEQHETALEILSKERKDADSLRKPNREAINKLNSERAARRRLTEARMYAALQVMSQTKCTAFGALKKVDDLFNRCGFNEEFLVDTDLIYIPLDI